jgi:hypothetical protein
MFWFRFRSGHALRVPAWLVSRTLSLPKGQRQALLLCPSSTDRRIGLDLLIPENLLIKSG